MKKFFIALGIACYVCISRAMLVKLPDTETLRTRFANAGFYRLVTETNIIAQLANKHTNVLSLFLDVELILSVYEHELHDSRAVLALEKRKFELLGLILYGKPQELAELRTIFSTIAD